MESSPKVNATFVCENWDGKSSWISSDEYTEACADFVLGMLGGRRVDSVLDAGCGRGCVTERLAEKFAQQRQAGVRIIGVDLSDNVPKQDSKLVSYRRQEIREFLTTQGTTHFSVIILKQMIHFIAEAEMSAFFDELSHALAPGGCVLVMMMPFECPIPLFPKAYETFCEGNIDSKFLVELAKDKGFGVSQSAFEFPVTIAAEQYHALIRGRFMSNLSKLSDEQVEQGVFEMDQVQQGKDYDFTDRLQALVFTKQE